MKKRKISAVWISASASFSVLAQGVPPSDITPGPRIQRLQQRQLDATRELNPRPNVLTPPGESPAATDIVTLPRDNPCFPVEQLVLEDDTFGWLARSLQPVVGQCVGKTALRQIQDDASELV